MFNAKTKTSVTFKTISYVQIFTLLVFFTFPPSLAQAQVFSVLSLPKPGEMVTTSVKFIPPLIKGISLHPENPLVFDFIIDPGNAQLSQDEIKTVSERLIKYFLASLTIPEDDLWVNLSPYENNKIIPQQFGETEMGRDLLAQDYVLKQLSASLIYPEKELGKDFWNRVYKKAKEVYGTTDIPLNTFNKVWIIPEKAVILETENTAYVVRSRMKVMLEQDYVALDQNRANEVLGTNYMPDEDVKKTSAISSDVLREIILPEIEKEVNEGKNFAQLRQIYNSLILADWFKNNLKDNLVNQIYSNQQKISGVDIDDKTDKEKIYQQYLSAYRQGVFNYIKEDMDEAAGEVIPRKYFSGGANFSQAMISRAQEVLDARSGNVKNLISSRQITQQELNPVAPNLFRLAVAFAAPTRFNAGVSVPSDSSVRPSMSAAMIANSDVSDLLKNQESNIINEGLKAIDRVKLSDAVSHISDLKNLQSRIALKIQSPNPQALGHLNQTYWRIVGSQIQKYAADKKVSSSSDLRTEVLAAREFLKKTPAYVADPIVQVIDTDQVTFGAILYNGKIYIEKPVLDQTPADSDTNFNQRTRLIIRTLAENQHDGERNSYNYAVQKFPNAVSALYPTEQALPNVVEDNIRKNLLGMLDAQESEALRQQVNAARKAVDPDAKEITQVIPPSAEVQQRSLEILNSARLTLYADANRRLDGKKNKERVLYRLSAAYDPATNAHVVTAGLNMINIVDANDGKLDVTVKNNRKPYLHLAPVLSFRERLTREVTEDILGGLLSVATSEGTLDKNGEGVFHKELINQVEDGSIFGLKEAIYGYGRDHASSFAFNKGTGEVSFTEITKDNIEETKAYVMLSGEYKNLIKLFLEKDGIDRIPPEHRIFFQSLANAENPSDLLKVDETSPVYFPELDVDGKLKIILDDIRNRVQQKYGESRPEDTAQFLRDFKIGKGIIPRPRTEFPDETSKEIEKDGFIRHDGIEGPGANVSSTGIRKGLLALNSGILDLNQFEGLFAKSLLTMLGNGDYKQYQSHLLRVAKFKGSKPLSAFYPLDSIKNESERQNRRFSRLENQVNAINGNLSVSRDTIDSSQPAQLIILTDKITNTEVARVAYEFESHYKEDQPQDVARYKIKVNNSLLDSDLKNNLAEKLPNIVEHYLRDLRPVDTTVMQLNDVSLTTLTGTSKDFAMISNDELYGTWSKTLDTMKRSGFVRDTDKTNPDSIENPHEWALPVSDYINPSFPSNDPLRLSPAVEKIERIDQSLPFLSPENRTNAALDLYADGIRGTGAERNFLSVVDVYNYLAARYFKDYSPGVAGNDADFYEQKLAEMNNADILPPSLKDLTLQEFIDAMNNPNNEQAAGLREILQSRTQIRSLLSSSKTAQENKKLLHKLYSMLAFLHNLATSMDKKPAASSAMTSDDLFEGDLGPISEQIRATQTNRINPKEAAREIGDRFQDALRNNTSFVQADNQPDYGGIDLNPANLKIEINKENGGINVQFDPKLLEQIREKGIEGFVPIIINIQPMTSVMPLLGASAEPAQREMQLTSI